MISNPRIFPDYSYFKHPGTTPFEVWYMAGGMNAVAPLTGGRPIDELQATPFLSGRGGKLDTIAIEVTTLAALGVGRIGVYSSVSNDNFYPDALLADSGEFSTATTGVKSATVNVELEPNRIYWLAVVFGVAAPVLRVPASNAMANPLGHPATLGGNTSRRMVSGYAYAAFPSTFPAFAGVVNGPLGVWFHLAS